jgi:hypothetical protein
MNHRRAIFGIDETDLAEFLRLKQGTRFISAKVSDKQAGVIEFVIEHETLPETQPGFQYRMIAPTVTIQPGGARFLWEPER